MPAIHKLTARNIAYAKRPGLYTDGAGLYLQVTRATDGAARRSWILRFTAPNGRRREMGLGSAIFIPLAIAREKAARARSAIAERTDPIDARRGERAMRAPSRPEVATFRQCADAYTEAHAPSWKNAKHRWQCTNSLERFAYRVFGDADIASIDDATIMRVLDPIWRTKTETASRLSGRLEAILDWARVRQYRTGDNPARWRDHLQKALPAPRKSQRVRHHPAMAYADISGFMDRLRAHPGVSARALEFTILTAARTGEALGASWSEIDLDAAIWTVPGERMKAGKVHRVPLAPRVVDILRARWRADATGPAFCSERTGDALSNMALLMLLRRMTGSKLTVHGFRSTFRDWAAEATDAPREIAEAALAHALADKVEAAYRRSNLFDKRRALMEAWAQYCDGSNR